MIYLIQRYIVKHIQILIHVASMHVQARRTFHTSRHSRLELKRLYDIGFTEYHRCPGNHIFRDIESTDIC